MLAGAAIVPTAPLLVPGVSPSLPDGVAAVSDAIDAVLDALPPVDTAVLVAVGQRGLHDTGSADLAGIGRPDIARETPVSAQAVTAITRVTQYPRIHRDVLPLGLSVLTLLLGDTPSIVPVAVPMGATFDTLVATGAGIVQGLSGTGLRAVMIAAGDCSAGLDERSPRPVSPPLYSSAAEWDSAVVAALDSGRLDRLAALGPAGAQRVTALGWAPMAVLHGACARAKLGVVRRHYSAPRGVGYLVAGGS